MGICSSFSFCCRSVTTREGAPKTISLTGTLLKCSLSSIILIRAAFAFSNSTSCESVCCFGISTGTRLATSKAFCSGVIVANFLLMCAKAFFSMRVIFFGSFFMSGTRFGMASCKILAEAKQVFLEKTNSSASLVQEISKHSFNAGMVGQSSRIL